MISASGLRVYYENMLALNGVDLDVEQGEVVGVFGANGAGKSTLLHALAGILHDMRRREAARGGERITWGGEVRYRGERIDDWPTHRRARAGIVLCPERRRLFGESPVLENLRIGGHLATAHQARRTLSRVLALFPALKPLLRRPAALLSGGEQQMLAIGRALMAQPRLLLLDEPLLGLAPAIQRDVVGAVRQIRERFGVTLVIAEQYARPVLPVVDRAIVLENGTRTFAGDREALMSDDDVKAAYFGV